MAQNIIYFLGMLIIFLLPFVSMYFLQKRVNYILKENGLPLRMLDLLTIYFFMGIHIFSVGGYGQSFLPHFIIFISLLGIIFASIYKFHFKSLVIKRFLKVWWRVVDLCAIAFYTILGILFFIRYF